MPWSETKANNKDLQTYYCIISRIRQVTAMENFKGEIMQVAVKAENQAVKEKTQYELTTDVVTKLNTYKITPTAKLVLLYLTTCYNPKHAEIFPKQKTIALKLGISERSVTRAIQELFNEGLILVEYKYTNRYKFTSKIAQKCPEKMSDNFGQNDIQKDDKLSSHDKEQKKETKKEQTGIILGGNVSKEDEILREYARKHGARNIDAYVNTLKKTKSAEKIINEKRKIVTRAVATLLESQKQIQIYDEYRKNRESYETSIAWMELGKKFGIKK